jgi:hypothetical protein
MANFKNPYADRPDFVDLGSYSVVDVKYDLYVLIGQLPGNISAGARYGDNHSDYESGAAVLDDNAQWRLYGTPPTVTAMALFFANHHDMLTKRTYPTQEN